MEKWKPVAGYEGYYEVSDMGRVRSVDHLSRTGIKHSQVRLVKGHVLKPHIKRSGYQAVDLSKQNVVKTVLIHKLVATAFLPKDADDVEVNHKNCIKSDNRVSNLEWCTSRENKDHAKENNRYHNPRKKAVRCKQTGQIFESSYKAAEWVNEHNRQNSGLVDSIANKIRAVCNGKQITCYGYTWEYI